MSKLIAEAKDQYSIANLGFWLYIMSDLMLFMALFTTYVVLKIGTAGGPGPADILEPKYALVETLILLTSSFLCGLALVEFRFKNTSRGLIWLIATIVLGMCFLGLESHEFSALVDEGNSWQRSGFLSAFFTLVGTHGLHISVGLLWAIVMVGVILRRGLNANVLRKISLFALFWHLLDIVWIFIFAIVYLIGGIS